MMVRRLSVWGSRRYPAVMWSTWEKALKQRASGTAANRSPSVSKRVWYPCSRTAVATAISGFVISLLEAVAIVIVVLLFFMGLRSGILIGFVLLLTIAGTFIFMGADGGCAGTYFAGRVDYRAGYAGG